MKLSRIITVSAIALFVMASCNNKKSTVRLKNEADSISYCLGISIGQSLKSASLTEFKQDAFDKAISEALLKVDHKIKQDEANAYIQVYFKKLQGKLAEKSKKEGSEFLASNKTKKGIVTTTSGLQYEVIKDGTGPMPTVDDVVTVHYKGMFVDGTVFQSSYDSGKPATLPVKGFIPGWTEILQLMKVGSKYKVYIPSELGYGENPDPRSGIKPNSVLIFEMELLAIGPKEDAKAKQDMKKR